MTVTNLDEYRRQRAAAVAAHEVATDDEAAERCFIAEHVASYHSGRHLVDDETAALWVLADALEESLDWTEAQRMTAAAVLQREICRRVREAGK